MVDLASGNPNRPGLRTVRTRGIAVRINVRALALSLIAAIVMAGLIVWAVGLGTIDIPMIDVARAIFGQADDRTELVVRTLRLPRILAAALVGAALAISGVTWR